MGAHIHKNQSISPAFKESGEDCVGRNTGSLRAYHNLDVRGRSRLETSASPSYRNMMRWTTCLCKKSKKRLRKDKLLSQAPKNKSRSDNGIKGLAKQLPDDVLVTVK